MSNIKTVEELAKYYDMDETKMQSIVFRVIDLLIDRENSDAVIDAGLHHNHGHNGMDNMIASYRAMLWATWEEIDRQNQNSKNSC